MISKACDAFEKYPVLFALFFVVVMFIVNVGIAIYVEY